MDGVLIKVVIQGSKNWIYDWNFSLYLGTNMK